MTTFFIILILAAVVAFIAQPFLAATKQSALPIRKRGMPQRRELREEKATALMALRELDFDYETGKLSVEDYKALREKYEGQAVRVLRELEEAEKSWSKAEREIDHEVEKRLGKLEKPHSFCSRCGAPQSGNDQFCASCGFSLRSAHG